MAGRPKAPKRSKAKPQAGDVSLDGAVVASSDVDVDQTEVGSRSDSKRDYQDFTCSTCRRRYTAGFKRSEGPPAERCCGTLACWALQMWTDDEWRNRARSALMRPPTPPGTRLHRRTPGVPSCGCGVGLDSFVVAELADGMLDVAAACPKCTTVVGRRLDDPTVLGGGWADRFIDREAVRRHPDIEAPEWAEQPVAAPVAEVVELTQPEPTPEPLCLLVSQGPTEWAAGCGRTVKNTKKTVTPGDVNMVAWGMQVTCPTCRRRDRSGYWSRREDMAA